MTRNEKYQQIKKEAGASGIVLVVLILFWLAAGFGLSGSQTTVLRLPLWVAVSCLGTWAAAVGLVIFLLKYVFRDMGLEDDDDE